MSSIARANLGGVGTSSLDNCARQSRMSGTCCPLRICLATSRLLAVTCVIPCPRALALCCHRLRIVREQAVMDRYLILLRFRRGFTKEVELIHCRRVFQERPEPGERARPAG